MKKVCLIIIAACMGAGLLAQQKAAENTQQFMLIVRYKPNMPTPAPEAVRTNGQRWGAFMADLAQSGKLVSGFRPVTGGRTIAGSNKTTKDGAYEAEKEVVSSVLIIKAASLEEATEIAKKCPIYEFDGSVEVRAVMNTAN